MKKRTKNGRFSKLLRALTACIREREKHNSNKWWSPKKTSLGFDTWWEKCGSAIPEDTCKEILLRAFSQESYSDGYGRSFRLEASTPDELEMKLTVLGFFLAEDE